MDGQDKVIELASMEPRSSPGIKHLQLAIECHFEPFNGAGDHSPDVTTFAVQPSLSGCSFNGARDCSLDVTILHSKSMTDLWQLQWSRGLLPGCNLHTTRNRIYMYMLQWGRGSLPGYNSSVAVVIVDDLAASMEPGITPRM